MAGNKNGIRMAMVDGVRFSLSGVEQMMWNFAGARGACGDLETVKQNGLNADDLMDALEKAQADKDHDPAVEILIAEIKDKAADGAPESVPEESAEDEDDGFGLVMIPVGLIDVSPDQTRVVEGTPELDAGIDELAESIRANGLIEPLVVRGPWRGRRARLIAGHRRLAACRRALLDSVPCYVREVQDEQAADMTVIENLQRRDLTPIEEAAGVTRLLALRGDQPNKHEAVAASLGKSVRWVYRRASLGSLIAPWRASAETYKLSAAYLEKIARMPADVQLETWEEMKEDEGVFARGGDIDVLSEELDVSLRKLESAPWKACLEKTCGGCADRSDARPDLFEDYAGTPRCLNRGCWDKKVKAFVAEGLKQLKAKHPTVIESTTKEAYLYAESKSPECSVPVLVTAGTKAGALLWAPSKQEAAGKAAAAKPKGPSKAELASQAYVRAVCACIEKTETQSLDGSMVAAFALGCGTNAMAAQSGVFDEPVKINRSLAAVNLDNVFDLLWLSVRGNIVKELDVDRLPYSEGLYAAREELAIKVKDALGLDEDMIEAFRKEFLAE